MNFEDLAAKFRRFLVEEFHETLEEFDFSSASTLLLAIRQVDEEDFERVVETFSMWDSRPLSGDFEVTE
jgi:hypothetical protein